MNICFDIDGVLADFGENMSRVVNLRWPGRIPAGYNPPNWDYTDNIAKAEWSQIWDDIKATPEFWRRQLPYERNVDAAVRYINSYTETTVYFMTARPDTIGQSSYEQTLGWLVNYGLYPYNREVTTPIIVKDPTEKTQIMIDLGIDFSIDDKQETVERCNKIEGHKAYLLDRSWNQTSSEPRVYSVDHFLDIVKGKYK